MKRTTFPQLDIKELGMAKVVDDLQAGPYNITMGMTHDEVIEILPDDSPTAQHVDKTDGVLTVFRKYIVGEKKFILGFRRVTDPGPYQLTYIGVLH